MNKKRINLAACLIGPLEKVATAKKGHIIVGGLIPPVALKLKRNFKGKMLASGCKLIGKFTITSTEIVDEKKGHFELQLPDGTTTLLPNVDRITLKNKENLLMCMTTEEVAATEPTEEEIERQVAQDMMDILRERANHHHKHIALQI